MFYIMHIDHHGNYQGILAAFKTIKSAKRSLDADPSLRRCGRVCTHTSHRTYACCIVEIDCELQWSEVDRGFDLPDEDDEEVSDEELDKVHGPIDRMLAFLQDNMEMLADDVNEVEVTTTMQHQSNAKAYERKRKVSS